MTPLRRKMIEEFQIRQFAPAERVNDFETLTVAI